MSYSKVVTEESLRNILNEVLPVSEASKLVYDQDVGNTIFNSTWTATDNGVIVLVGTANSSGNLAYWYVSDTTQNIEVGTLCWDNANQTRRSTSFPVIKGHTYAKTSAAALQAAHAYFFKFRSGDVPITIADYIVEQGTSGIWTYRKWNSGIAECWGTSAVASNAYAVNGAKNVVASFPFTFATAPVVLVSGYISGHIPTDIGFTQSGTTQAQTYLINRGPAAVTATGGVYWELKGRWK